MSPGPRPRAAALPPPPAIARHASIDHGLPMSKKQVFQFLDVPRDMPRKVPLQLRTDGDRNELYGRFGQAEAAHQAGRCLDCVNPYCEAKCPFHNYIPNWLQLVEEGRILEAAALCHETNP